ncbi:hypothetical protein PMAYCL1PPCAC_23571 [Pristionchus mayeri]|uniref:C2 domain-containing protein n=1 Tax=Pristionchus mayeri TaxID=1317129 RepID=A0AAN5CYF7_9BILA|nr:hypothetical protein PMAYCL1PPCAC_23571 [Pristionchus mayeri]
MPVAHRVQSYDWAVGALIGVSGGIVLISALALLIVNKRRKASHQYPHLLQTNHSIAVKNALSMGPGGLRQSVSPLQSPLSSNQSTPSPINSFASIMDERTRRLSPSELPMERGKVNLVLSYDQLATSLQVGVLSCETLCQLSLSPSGQCLLDPYVKLQLLPDRDHRVKSRIVRATNNPQFDEHFTMYGVSLEQLAASTLHVQVCAFDRYSRDAIVGETTYRLAEGQLTLKSSVSLCLPLGPESLIASKGEVLLSLTYQPALNNLTVVIVKARGLMGTPDPYAKLSLRDSDGKRLAKKRTHVKRAAKNPVYNESFVFELPQSQLKQAVIDIQMMQHVNGHSESIGRVVLNGADSHVADVITRSDKQIAQWHALE